MAKWITIQIKERQAFEIWKSLDFDKISGFGVLMRKLWKAFDGEKSKYYKEYVKNECV